METRANYVLLGAATVIAVGLAFLFAMWIARESFAREYSVYDVVFTGAARGIGAGTEVRFNGIRVGEVQSLFIDEENENQVVARIRIGSVWPVRADSDARLEPIGLTGLNLIQISAGSEDSPRLRQRLGEPPPRIPARQGALDELLDSSGDLARNATEALAGARDILSQENAERIERILVNLEQATTALAAERGLLAKTAEAAAELRQAARAFSGAAVEVEALAKQGQTTLAEAEQAIEQVGTAATNIGDAAASVDAAANVAAVSLLPELASTAAELRRLSQTLDRVAAGVERSPTFAVVGGQKPVVKVAP